MDTGGNVAHGAIWHSRTKIFSRKKNHSVVAKAAYRASEDLYSEFDGKWKRSNKNEEFVRHTEIFTPDVAPTWARDRERLWNEVEAAEKRKDAQLAREFEAALPRGLDLFTNIRLAKEFVQEQFVELGMVVDLAVHEKPASDGGMNIHFHAMLTMRDISMDGFGKKNRDWNDRALHAKWRDAWQDKVNEALEDAGSELRISNKSYAEQGIVKEPQPKLGPKLAAMAARGENVEFLDQHSRFSKHALREAVRPPNDEEWRRVQTMRLIEKSRVRKENEQNEGI